MKQPSCCCFNIYSLLVMQTRCENANSTLTGAGVSGPTIYLDAILASLLLIIWIFEIVKRSGLSSCLPPGVRLFLTDLMHFDFKADSCRIVPASLDKESASSGNPRQMNVGNWARLDTYPSTLLRRKDAIQFVGVGFVLVLQYVYVLQGRLCAESLCWPLVYIPLTRFLQCTSSPSDALGGKKTNPARYAFSSLWSFLQLLAGLACVKLVQGDWSSQTLWILPMLLYLASIIGVTIQELSFGSWIGGNGSERRLLEMVISGDFYVGFTRFDVFAYAFTLSALVIYLFVNLMVKEYTLASYSVFLVLSSLTYGFVTSMFSFARKEAPSDQAMFYRVMAITANLLLGLGFVYTTLTLYNSLCSFSQVSCSVSVYEKYAHEQGYIYGSFLPWVISLHILTMGISMAPFVPETFVSCEKSS